MRFAKAIKNLKNDFQFLAIVELILIVASIVMKKYFMTVTSSIFFIFLVKGYSDTIDKKKSAGVIGLVVGIIMISSILWLDLIDFLLGIFLVIHSVKYRKFVPEDFTDDKVITYSNTVVTTKKVNNIRIANSNNVNTDEINSNENNN